MLSSTLRQREVLKYLRIIEEAVQKLKVALDLDTSPPDYYRRRKHLLKDIFSAAGSVIGMGAGVPKDRVFRLLDRHRTAHQWLGQQVKKGYLRRTVQPDGQVFYWVTPKAVQELRLTEKEDDEEEIHKE